MSQTSRRILVIGDVMTDYVVLPEGPIALGSDRRARIFARAGGSAATQAVWLARLGVKVDFVGRVGAADVSIESLRLSRAGVDPWLAADEAKETGRLIAIVDPSGERSFLTDRGANDALEPSDIPDLAIERADHIHISGYSLFAPSPRAAARWAIDHAGRRPISVDAASAEFLRQAGAEAFFAWTEDVAMLFPNAEEAAVLAGTEEPDAQGKALGARYPLVVIKRGAAGCEAWRNGEVVRAGAPQAKVLDTTGAGDAFVAAFLAAHLSGAALEACLSHAVAAGSAATEFIGGRPPDPA